MIDKPENPDEFTTIESGIDINLSLTERKTTSTNSMGMEENPPKINDLSKFSESQHQKMKIILTKISGIICK